MTVAIVTVSTRAAGGVYDDRSGAVLAELIAAAGHEIVHRSVVPDDLARLTRLLGELADGDVDLVVTTGGTGLTPNDLTPEATVATCERLVPGIAEAIRMTAYPTIPHAALSRGVAGICGSTLIVNLPGSPGGARDGWAVLAPIATHAVSQIRGGDHPRPAAG